MPFLLKDSSWYLNNSLLCQPNFSSAAKKLHSILKTQENNHSSAKDRWKYTKSCFKENARNSKFNHSRKYQNFKTEKEVTKPIRKINPNQKLNQLSKIYKMNFTNQKTNKQKVQNFVLPSDGSLRAKNALKLFSKYLKERICKIKQDLNLY